MFGTKIFGKKDKNKNETKHVHPSESQFPLISKEATVIPTSTEPVIPAPVDLSATPAELIKAASDGNLEFIKKHSNQAKTFATSDKSNLLHYAAENGHVEVMEYLIEKLGVNVNQEAYLTYDTPLLLAVRARHVNATAFLINYNPPYSNCFVRALYLAIIPLGKDLPDSTAKIRIVEMLLPKVNLNSGDSNFKNSTLKQGLLAYAASYQQYNIMTMIDNYHLCQIPIIQTLQKENEELKATVQLLAERLERLEMSFNTENHVRPKSPGS